MRVLILTDVSPGRPGHSAHASLLGGLVKEMGHEVEEVGADRYRLRFGETAPGGVWSGPGLSEAAAAPGVLLPRVSTYGSWGLRVAHALAHAGWRSAEDLEAFAVAGDKLLAQQALESARLPVIPTAAVSGRSSDGPPLPYPVVVKARRGSSGRDVLLVRDGVEWRSALSQLWRSGDDGVLVQPYLRPPEGRRPCDVRIHVVAGTPMFGVARTAAEGEWRTNSSTGSRGRALEDARLLATGDMAAAAVGAVGLIWAAVDLLETDEGLRVCEVNPSPGLSAVVGVVGREKVAAACRAVLRHAERL